MDRSDTHEGLGERGPGTIATLALALLLLGFLAWLVVALVRDCWVILITLMQP